MAWAELYGTQSDLGFGGTVNSPQLTGGMSLGDLDLRWQLNLSTSLLGALFMWLGFCFRCRGFEVGAAGLLIN